MTVTPSGVGREHAAGAQFFFEVQRRFGDWHEPAALAEERLRDDESRLSAVPRSGETAGVEGVRFDLVEVR